MSNIKEDNKEVKFLSEAYNALDYIYENNSTKKALENWKEQVLIRLKGTYETKIKRIVLFRIPPNPWSLTMIKDEHEYKMAKAVLEDIGIIFSLDSSKKDTIEIKKLQKVRENNIDFEQELANMISGKNKKFPIRNSNDIFNFFKKLGYSLEHINEKKINWLEEILEELNIKKIHEIITKGLFSKKYYDNALNKPIITTGEDFLKEAKFEFKQFIQNSLSDNQITDLTSILDLNINLELLFDNDSKTKDTELNKIIEDSKERFISGDKQIAIEKLWDAFERLKTYFSTDKKTSSIQLVSIISENFDTELINDEFSKLTRIGNSYRIRHHETDKNELTEQHRNYFFFRMLSLIDLCLSFINEEELNEVNLF